MARSSVVVFLGDVVFHGNCAECIGLPVGTATTPPFDLFGVDVALLALF